MAKDKHGHGHDKHETADNQPTKEQVAMDSFANGQDEKVCLIEPRRVVTKDGKPQPYMEIAGRTTRVTSRILSLNFKAEDGTKYTVPVGQLHKSGKDTAENQDDYRFMQHRTVPCLGPDASRSREDLHRELDLWLDKLAEFDAADFVAIMTNPDKKVRKSFKLLTDGAKSDPKPVSPEQLAYDLITGAWVLRQQASMNDPLRAMAEATLREEIGINAPASKVRERKVRTTDIIGTDDTLEL
jgi:hypothetical protein